MQYVVLCVGRLLMNSGGHTGVQLIVGDITKNCCRIFFVSVSNMFYHVYLTYYAHNNMYLYTSPYKNKQTKERINECRVCYCDEGVQASSRVNTACWCDLS